MRILCVAAIPSPFYVDQITQLYNNVDWCFFKRSGQRQSWGMLDEYKNERPKLNVLKRVILNKYDVVILNTYADLFCFLIFIIILLFKRKTEVHFGIFEEIKFSEVKSIKNVIRTLYIKKFIAFCDVLLPCGNVALKTVQPFICEKTTVRVTPYAFRRKRVPKNVNCLELGAKFTILYSGAVNKRRNLEELVEAINNCDLRVQEKVCLFISAPYNQELFEFMKNMSRYVYGFEIIYDKPRSTWESILEIYSTVNMTVVPNIYSSWNMTVQESLSFGVPVVGTNTTAAVREFVCDGHNGSIYQSGRVDCLSEILSSYVTNEQFYTFIKDNCRASMGLYYSETIASLYQNNNSLSGAQ